MSARRGGYRMRGKLPDAAAAISRYATNYVRKNLGLVFPVSSFIWTCNQLALLSLLERRKVSECSPPAGRPKLDNNRINLERHLSGLRPSSERTGAKLEMPAARYVTIPWQSRNRKQFWEINMFVSASAFLGFFLFFFLHVRRCQESLTWRVDVVIFVAVLLTATIAGCDVVLVGVGLSSRSALKIGTASLLWRYVGLARPCRCFRMSTVSIFVRTKAFGKAIYFQLV